MEQISARKEKSVKHQSEINSFVRSLKHYPLTKQQIKTLRGQALAGDLVGAQKGLERTVSKHEYNREV